MFEGSRFGQISWGNECTGTSSQSSLTDLLFSNYDNGVTPVCGGVPSRVNVTLDVALRQIVDLDEPLQIITLNLWVRMEWTDCRLKWNESEFGNMSSVTVPMDRVWIPDLTLYDSVNKESRDTSAFKAAISSSGEVRYNYPTLTESRCKVNVKHFPFDKQTCKLIFGSWAYSGLEIDVNSKNEKGDTSSIDQNVEWEIANFRAVRHEVTYSCCPEPYPDVTFYLELNRKPDYYIFHILLPCILISAIGVLGFLMPVESGEKVSVGVTILLSQAVFLILVGEKLPPSSETLPLIAIYFDFAMFLVCLACLISVVVLNFHYTNSRHVPGCVRAVFLGFLARLVCVQTRSNNVTFIQKVRDIPEPGETERTQSPRIPTNIGQTTIGNGLYLPPETDENKIGNTKDNVSIRGEQDVWQEPEKFHSLNDWQLIAQVLDRVGLFVYSVCFVIGTITFLSLFQEG